jgi:cell division protein FtsI/penicillin-binding protein 2
LNPEVRCDSMPSDCCFLAAAIVILARVYWVQTRLPGEYLTALQVTSSEDELLPARDGRILADSIVLASDVDVYSVEVHYRWLQDVIDSQWLRLQVRQQLSREERRDSVLVSQVEDQIRKERASLREILANVTKIPLPELTARFSKVEERVQRVSDAVNLRRTEPEVSASDNVTSDSDEHTEDDAGVLLSIATSVRTALTTPPTRTEEDRIVVREEETWHRVLEDVGFDVAALINEHPEKFPGVRVTRSARRTYPENTLAAHVVGVRTSLRDADLSDDETDEVSLADLTNSRAQIGRSGVERSYDHQLLGVAGIRRTIRDRRQRVISSEIIRHPVSGRDVTLTLDFRLQQLSEQLLAESLGDAPRLLLPTTQAGDDPTVDTAAADSQPTPVGGCILVMEADSGRLMAAASAPTFRSVHVCRRIEGHVESRQQRYASSVCAEVHRHGAPARVHVQDRDRDRGVAVRRRSHQNRRLNAADT